MTPGELTQSTTDLGRAGKADLLDKFAIQGCFETVIGRGTVGDHDLQDLPWHSTGVEDLRHRLGDRRGLLGGLPHDGVAGDECGHDVPGRHGRGEVARGDDHGGADRHAEGEELLIGHLARDRLTVEPAALPEEEVTGVDHLLHVTQRLGVDLAHLAGHKVGE